MVDEPARVSWLLKAISCVVLEYILIPKINNFLRHAAAFGNEGGCESDRLPMRRSSVS